MQSQFNSESSSFLFQSLRRLYFFAQIFGSASFSYSPEPEIGVHIKPINAMTFVLAVVIYSTTCYLNAVSELTIHANGYQASFLHWLEKRIAKIMEKILALDDEMKEMGISSEQTDHLLRYEIIFFIFCFSGAFSILCFYYYVQFYVDGSAIAKWAIYIGFTLMMGNQLLLSSVVAAFYVAIQIEFSLLNEYFSYTFIPPRLPSVELQRITFKLARIHDSLCQLFSTICNYSAMVLIAGPLNIICLTIFSLELLLVGYIERNFKLQLLAVCFLYFTLHAYLVGIVVVYVVASTTSKARYTGVLVHRALFHTNDVDLMTKLELFSMQILHANPRCSLIVIDFDWELVFAVVSVTLSYASILMQYQYFVSTAKS